MIKETATVLSIEDDALWVETEQSSACSGCGVEKECGQNTLFSGLMGKASANTTAIRALLSTEDKNHYQVNDQVLIGVPDHVVVSGTLLLYLLPLLTMIIGVTVVYHWGGSDAMMALGALFGLVAGSALVRFRSRKHRQNPAIQPRVLGKP